MISLLWPQRPLGYAPPPPGGPWPADLDLHQVVAAIDRRGQRAGFVRGVLGELCCDEATIRARQDLVDDLVALPELAAALERTLPGLATLAQPLPRWGGDEGVFRVGTWVTALELYVATAHSLHGALDASRGQLRGAGLLALHGALAALLASDELRGLAEELPLLRAQLDRAGSVTLGINLDGALRPESATILGLSPGRFAGPATLLGRLLRGLEGQGGLFPLRQASERQLFTPERQLFQDLEQLLEGVTAPVTAALERYRQVKVAPLGLLEPELVFLIGAASLVRGLRGEGHALSRPEIAPMGERVCCVGDVYSLPLLLRLREAPGIAPAPVTSDICMGEDGRVWTLTGPNRGGKTTYTRAVGLVHVLAQAGLPVPGSQARISPVDGIYTLFPAAEQARLGMGRLDEEAAFLATVFQRASAHSLVLLNEPLTSTSPADALLIGRDVLCGLRALGCRGLFVTHLHELAQQAPTLNTRVDGASRIGSLVAEVTGNGNGSDLGHQATFRIAPGQPQGQSHAATIAAQHGLQLDQIMAALEARGQR